MSNGFVAQVAGIINRYSMLPGGAPVGVAVSGGADSVALLHILKRLDAPVSVLHVNHQLRGAESDEDEEFVHELARSLGVPFHAERTQLGPGNLEQAARNARRDFFRRCREQFGFERIALGHSQSDQAETVLYRLVRGSGTAGLAGMEFVTADGFVRPLLASPREAIRVWAQSEGIVWREDSSNGETRFARNRLRHQVFPILGDLNPAVEANLAATALVARDEEDFWKEQIERLFVCLTRRSELGLMLNAAALAQLHPAEQRRLLRRCITELRENLRGIDIQHVEGIRAICSSQHGHDRVIIPGIDAVRSFDTLLLTFPGKLNEDKRHYTTPLKFDEVQQLPFENGSVCIGLQFCVTFEKGHTPTESLCIDGDALPGPVCVRNWEPGDAIHRDGHASPEKLKTLFQEHRILLWERRHWPVAVCGDQIIWARSFGLSKDVQATPTTSNPIQFLYWQPPDKSAVSGLGLNRKQAD